MRIGEVLGPVALFIVLFGSIWAFVASGNFTWAVVAILAAVLLIWGMSK